MFKLSKSYNWLIYRIINESIKSKFSKYAKGKMLDIGCGEKPYKEMLDEFVDWHVGIDHSSTLHKTSNIDIFCTIYSIPVVNCTFDSVLCSDVLEHLEEPKSALVETFRVLKPNGFAIFTVPLLWHIHEKPRDFYRYTEYGLKYLFVEAGFKVVEITPLTGFCATFSQELVYFLYRYRGKRKINPVWWFVFLLGHIIQVCGYLANKIDRSYGFTAEYIVVAQKPYE